MGLHYCPLAGKLYRPLERNHTRSTYVVFVSIDEEYKTFNSMVVCWFFYIDKGFTCFAQDPFERSIPQQVETIF